MKPSHAFIASCRHATTITLVLLSLTACGSKVAPPAAAAIEAETAGDNAGLVLDKEQTEKLGVVTQAAKTASYAPEISGYGQVLGHESIALMLAEIATATAASRQSGAALARMKQLAGTPGAFPLDAQEAAERQAVADAAALNLAQQKLTAALGQHGPWAGDEGRSTLADLAAGRAKLVRATFPSGSLGGGTPRRLRVARFEPGAKVRNWTTGSIWEAPADAAVPGRSFFALLRARDVSEGERVQVWAASSDDSAYGVLIPAAALVLNNDAYWCFVEKPAGTFIRVAVDASRPQDDGYFVSVGIAPGDEIVTAAAGLLLARELSPSTEAE